MQSIAPASAAASRIESDERQSKPLHKSGAAHHRLISATLEAQRNESLEQMKLNYPLDSMASRTIGGCRISVQNISMMPQLSGAGFADSWQQPVQRHTPYDKNIPYDMPESADKTTLPVGAVAANNSELLASLNRPSIDSDTDSDTDSETESSTTNQTWNLPANNHYQCLLILNSYQTRNEHRYNRIKISTVA